MTVLVACGSGASALPALEVDGEDLEGGETLEFWEPKS